MSIKIDDIKELVKLVEEADINELDVEIDGAKVKIKKGNTGIAAAQATAEKPEDKEDKTSTSAQEEEEKLPDNIVTITAPMVGTFYRAPSPGAEAFVETGQIVEPGQELCIIEAMKLMNTIECDFRGRVLRIMVENAQPVEYGQPMFLMERL